MEGGSRIDLVFPFAVFNIIVSDIVLAGDNAVVIAMAVRSLAPAQRRMGISLGAALAVGLRIVLTFFVAQLLNLPYLKLVGGLLILWIAVKVLMDSTPDEGGHKQAAGIWHAMWMILIADITMSLDNVLAVAGASKGNIWLLVFGLGLSIPLVVGASSVLSSLMDRYPIIAILGSAVLGRVGAELILSDMRMEPALRYSLEFASAVLVVLIAKLLLRRRSAAARP